MGRAVKITTFPQVRARKGADASSLPAFPQVRPLSRARDD